MKIFINWCSNTHKFGFYVNIFFFLLKKTTDMQQGYDTWKTRQQCWAFEAETSSVVKCSEMSVYIKIHRMCVPFQGWRHIDLVRARTRALVSLTQFWALTAVVVDMPICHLISALSVFLQVSTVIHFARFSHKPCTACAHTKLYNLYQWTISTVFRFSDSVLDSMFPDDKMDYWDSFFSV